MLFLSLKTPQVPNTLADGIELRLDFFTDLSKQALASFLEKVQKPVLFTLRKPSQGGHFQGSEEERLFCLKNLLSLKPEFVDIEYDTEPSFVESIVNTFPETKIIISYHNFEKTPSDLSFTLQKMYSPYAYGYKIATQAHSTLDALRMLFFIKNNTRVSGICMGKEGSITRILAPVVGSFINYAHEGEETAPGQLSISTLNSIYNYSRLGPKTKLFGLIGDPIDQSIGHHVHNAVMRAHTHDAVYVKMRITKEELSEFLPLAQACGFLGLSVTAPLKELITNKEAINTLVFHKNTYLKYNTDGLGALDALESHIKVKNKKIALLGSGGAAHAIGLEALHRKAHLTIYNRTEEKAHILAQKLGCDAGCMHKMSPYDILINATSSTNPISSDDILPNTYIMDIHTLPRITPLLAQAQLKGCSIIYGYEMFINQAAGQLKLFFKHPISKLFIKNQCKKHL